MLTRACPCPGFGSVQQRTQTRVGTSPVQQRTQTRVGTSPARPRSLSRLHAKSSKFTSFEDMIASYPVVLLDCYATWCGPCQYQSGVLSQCSAELKSLGVQTIKLDTEKYPKVATDLRVAGLPTLMLFKGGQQVARIEGALSAVDLVRWVKASVL